MYTWYKYIIQLRQVKNKKKFVYTKLLHFYAHTKNISFVFALRNWRIDFEHAYLWYSYCFYRVQILISAIVTFIIRREHLFIWSNVKKSFAFFQNIFEGPMMSTTCQICDMISKQQTNRQINNVASRCERYNERICLCGKVVCTYLYKFWLLNSRLYYCNPFHTLNTHKLTYKYTKY